MVKYSMLRERVTESGICGPGELRVPEPVSDEEILRAHDPDYLDASSPARSRTRRSGASASRGRDAWSSAPGAPPAGLWAPASPRWKRVSPRTWQAAPTTPSPTGARATASSTTPPSPPAPCRPQGSSSGCSSSTPTCTRATGRPPSCAETRLSSPSRSTAPRTSPSTRRQSDLDVAPPRRRGRRGVPRALEEGLETALDASEARACDLPRRRRPFRGRPPRAASRVTKRGLAERDRTGPRSLPRAAASRSP